MNRKQIKDFLFTNWKMSGLLFVAGLIIGYIVGSL